MPRIQNVPGLNIVKVVEEIMGVSHELHEEGRCIEQKLNFGESSPGKERFCTKGRDLSSAPNE